MPMRDDTPPKPRAGRRFRARDALLAIGAAALILLLFEGPSIRRQGEELSPGGQRTLVLAVGRPAGWLSGELGLGRVGHRLTSWLSPDDGLGANAKGGFDVAGAAIGAARGGVPVVTPDAFDPRALGVRPKPLALHTLLVTGDSMAQPLDITLAGRLAGKGVKVIRDPHVGTGISKPIIVDWGKLSVAQTAKDHPDAVVVFIGANEGFPMKTAGPPARTVACCGLDWATEYANRARRMMNTYRRAGAGRVVWLTLPLPREAARRKIALAVNAAVEVAAEPYRAQVQVLDMAALFTPGGTYRDAMKVGGTDTIVRQADGVHLNEAGAKLAADAVQAALRPDFGP